MFVYDNNKFQKSDKKKKRLTKKKYPVTAF